MIIATKNIAPKNDATNPSSQSDERMLIIKLMVFIDGFPFAYYSVT
jgi:hypothetical protein